jgi:hypothetical protein
MISAGGKTPPEHRRRKFLWIAAATPAQHAIDVNADKLDECPDCPDILKLDHVLMHHVIDRSPHTFILPRQLRAHLFCGQVNTNATTANDR